MQIPDFLQSFLESNSYSHLKTIQYSSWKKTFVLKIADYKGEYVLKAFSRNSPADIKRKFRNEADLYKTHTSPFLPKLIFVSDQILVIDYIQGMTLREYVQKQANPQGIIDELVKGIEGLYEGFKLKPTEAMNFGNAIANLNSLAQSGPIQTRKLPLIQLICNKLLARVLIWRLKRILRICNTANLRYGFAHGDFHLNNIFVTTSGNIKFIDFENVNYNQFFDFDILYLQTIMEVQKGSRDPWFYGISVFRNHFNEIQEMKAVVSLYRLAISANPRFNPEALELFQRFRLFLRILFMKKL